MKMSQGLNIAPQESFLDLFSDVLQTSPSKPSNLTLAECLQTTPINPQSSSPLYNGRIPPEIRDLIFAYALAEHVVPVHMNPFVKDPFINFIPHFARRKMPFDITSNRVFETNTDYARPGYSGLKKVSTALLRTCRRAYLESHHLPPVTKEHVFWHNTGPPNLQFPDEESYFRRFTKSQLQDVKEVHMFVQQYWLEHSLIRACELEVMQGIEKLKLSIRRCDWWYNQRNAPLKLLTGHASMNRSFIRRTQTGFEARKEMDWTFSFQHLGGLKELELEMEAFEYKREELQAIVEGAKKWMIPCAHEGYVLSAKDLEVKTWNWRGPLKGWNVTICQNCPQKGKLCGFCEEMNESKRKGLGPMLVVMSVRWKLIPIPRIT